MTYILRFTPDTSDGLGKWADVQHPHYYLVRLGEQWPSDPRNRLIQATTPDIEQAKTFDNREDAQACHAECGSPNGWNVVEVN